jgi:hypothetical protein
VPVDRFDVHWPRLGISRRFGFQNNPEHLYSCPDSLNVRNTDSLQKRLRGGSRPGLVRVLATTTGTTTEIGPTKDVHVQGDLIGDDINFNGTGLNVGTDGTVSPKRPYRTLLHYDLSNLPSTATIIAASLILTRFDGQGTGIAAKIYRLTQTNWTEAGCTWNKYDGTTDWTTPGGDYDLTTPTPIDWSIVSSEVTTISVLAHAVDAWTVRLKQMHIILKQDVETGSVLEFGRYHDKESVVASEANQVRLSITYTVPT